MKIGIVGAEAAKFTEAGKDRAIEAIEALLHPGVIVVSGHCHLGGIDIWAEDLAADYGLETEIYPPETLVWSTGFKPRNLQIARACDLCVCIGVDKLPPNFKGMTFKGCYHCARSGCSTPHVKSGGCWTVLQAGKLGKEMRWIIVEN